MLASAAAVTPPDSARNTIDGTMVRSGAKGILSPSSSAAAIGSRTCCARCEASVRAGSSASSMSSHAASARLVMAGASVLRMPVTRPSANAPQNRLLDIVIVNLRWLSITTGYGTKAFSRRDGLSSGTFSQRQAARRLSPNHQPAVIKQPPALSSFGRTPPHRGKQQCARASWIGCSPPAWSASPPRRWHKRKGRPSTAPSSGTTVKSAWRRSRPASRPPSVAVGVPRTGDPSRWCRSTCSASMISTVSCRRAASPGVLPEAPPCSPPTSRPPVTTTR